jgi:hypothetical protein
MPVSDVDDAFVLALDSPDQNELSVLNLLPFFRSAVLTNQYKRR